MSLSFFSNSQLYYSVIIADFQGKTGLKIFFGKDEKQRNDRWEFIDQKILTGHQL